MRGLDLGEFPDAVGLALFGKTVGGIEVGLARVAVVELLGEKVADAQSGPRAPQWAHSTAVAFKFSLALASDDFRP